MAEAPSLCSACRYPDCIFDALRLDRDFARDEDSEGNQERPYDESTVLSASALYQACHNYRAAVGIAADLLDETPTQL